MGTVILKGQEVTRFFHALGIDRPDDVRHVRVSMSNPSATSTNLTIKVKVNEEVWSAPLGENEETPRIRTEDGQYVSKGDRVFNYYGMKYCIISENPDNEGWFSTTNDDGTRGDLLNGERICTVAYAARRYPNA